jgi:hypothetical protein
MKVGFYTCIKSIMNHSLTKSENQELVLSKMEKRSVYGRLTRKRTTDWMTFEKVDSAVTKQIKNKIEQMHSFLFS